MTDPGLLRFLELLVREFSAVDARVELGGRDPDDPCLVFRTAPHGGRVVVIFDAPPADRAAVEQRLDALMGPLFGAVEHAVVVGFGPSRTPPDIAGRRLDDELGRLAERAGAAGAVVFDLASPVIWGAAKTAGGDVDRLLDRLIDHVRETHGELRSNHTSRLRITEEAECLVRPFAGLYVIGLAFEGLLSEPVALGAILHTMPIIERLVIALPPVDPPPGGAKVMRMPARLR